MTLDVPERFKAANAFWICSVGVPRHRIRRAHNLKSRSFSTGSWLLDPLRPPGGRFEWLAKVALGATTTDLNINGTTTTTAGGVTATAAGGLLALSSNIGRHSDSRFSTVSEFSTRVAYQLSPHWRGHVGYDVMYWTGVVRPGGAIDTVVNPNLIPPVAPGGPPVRRFNLARQTFGRRESALG